MAKFCLNVDEYRERVKSNLFAFIERLPADKAWQVEVEPLKKERSSKQNRALFGVAYAELEEQTGNEKNDLHEYFLGEYFGWVDHKVMGIVKRKPSRTTTANEAGQHELLSTEQFANFYSFIQRRAAESGFYVSDPDPLFFRRE